MEGTTGNCADFGNKICFLFLMWTGDFHYKDEGSNPSVYGLVPAGIVYHSEGVTCYTEYRTQSHGTSVQ